MKPLLLGLPVLVRLFLVDLLLVFVAVLGLVEPDLNGDEVLVHAVDHVFILPLNHHLVRVGVLDPIEPVLGAGKAVGLAEDVILNSVLLVLRLLQFALHLQRHNELS